MNVLFVSPFDLVHGRLWGPSSRIFALAKEFRAMGHNAYLAGSNPFGQETVPEKEGVPFLYLPVYPFHRYPYDEKTRRLLAEARKPFTYIRMLYVALKRAMAIKRICREKSIEVIYLGRTFPESALACRIVRFLTGIPMVVDWDDVEGLHGFSSAGREPLLLQYIYTFCETWYAVKANAVVVASRYLYDFSLDIGVKPERLFFARTVGDHNIFAPASGNLPLKKNPKQPTLLYTGNLRKENGVKVENVIHAFALVKKSCPGARLLMLGGGELHELDGKPGELPRLAGELGIEDSVEFAGDVPYSEMPAYTARADICLALFPVNVITLSKSPIKVYEYMCAGKPVVARAVGEINDCIKDGENGYLVYTDDPEEYAKKIVEALGDPDRLEQVGQKARKTVLEKFNWNSSAKEALKACEKALSE